MIFTSDFFDLRNFAPSPLWILELVIFGVCAVVSYIVWNPDKVISIFFPVGILP